MLTVFFERFYLELVDRCIYLFCVFEMDANGLKYGNLRREYLAWNLYTNRLKCLGLTTLELRRLHVDLIFCHKIVFINFSDIFEFSHVSKTRGHAYKLFKSHSNNSTRYRFFCWKSCQRVEFLAASVNFSTFGSFKHSITDVDFTNFLKYA